MQTKIERIHLPAELVKPIPEPGRPPVPHRDLVLNDVIEWYEAWIGAWRHALRQAEADKAAVRAWAENDSPYYNEKN